MADKEILQANYPFLTIDVREKDIVQIWCNGDVVQIERENISALISILEKESTTPKLF